ncbi:MAG TPA: solute carrier family 23 protein [Thermodesulfobacteriota bacterium]|nr:solute carrier family 23 protein [Thermodesulfobacteriota bacterium]
MATRPDDLIYTVDDFPPWPRLILLGLQNVVLISIYLVFIVIISNAAGSPQHVTVSAISLGMIAVAIATMLQAIWKGPVGSGFLAPPVFSAIYLGPSLLAAKAGGLPAVFAMTIFAGAIEVLLSRYLQHLRGVFPPSVSGFIVLIVGIELGLVGMDQVLDVGAYKGPQFSQHLFVSVLTLAIIISLSVWFRGLMRLMCSMLGIVVGFLVAIPLGLVEAKSLELFSSVKLFALPDPWFISYHFEPSLIPAFLTAGVASALRTIGVITTCQKINDADWKRPEIKSIKGGMLADGIGCMLGGLLGAPGMNAAPSLVGVSKASGATSRYIAFSAGVIFILIAFLPKVASVFLLLPMPVVGAALVANASFMMAGGIQIMVSRNIDTRVTYVIGVSLLLGLSRKVFPGYFEQLPHTLQLVTGTVLSLAVICAVLLNLLFRIGIRRTQVFVFEESDISLERLTKFLQAQKKSWGLSEEVIERSVSTTTQVVHHLQEVHLILGSVKILVSYDQVDLVINIEYQGTLLSLPNVGQKKRVFVEEEAFAYGLADFLTGVYPDRMELSSKGKNANIRLYFSA